jgi:hypothetical protein
LCPTGRYAWATLAAQGVHANLPSMVVNLNSDTRRVEHQEYPEGDSALATSCRSSPFACSPSPGVATMLHQRSLCIFMQPYQQKGVFAIESLLHNLIPDFSFCRIYAPYTLSIRRNCAAVSTQRCNSQQSLAVGKELQEPGSQQ